MINLRGKVIPVIDLRLRFDLVSFGGSLSKDYILGMAKSGEGVKILLDIDRVLYVRGKRVDHSVGGTGRKRASLDVDGGFL